MVRSLKPLAFRWRLLYFRAAKPFGRSEHLVQGLTPPEAQPGETAPPLHRGWLGLLPGTGTGGEHHPQRFYSRRQKQASPSRFCLWQRINIFRPSGKGVGRREQGDAGGAWPRDRRGKRRRGLGAGVLPGRARGCGCEERLFGSPRPRQTALRTGRVQGLSRGVDQHPKTFGSGRGRASCGSSGQLRWLGGACVRACVCVQVCVHRGVCMCVQV